MSEALICVVSYNNLSLTKQACLSLREQTFPTRIVVWDNASSDGTQDWLRDQEWLTAELSPENVYWTPAINRAIAKYSNGEAYIGYMNNDAAPMPHTVERLVNLLREDEVGLVAPSMSRIGGPQDIAFCEGHGAVQKGGDIEEAISKFSPKRVTYVLGAMAMLRRDVWDEVGPLADDMPLGADDHDYAIRIKEAGYQVWVAQNAFCEHAGHASGKIGAKAWDDLGSQSWQVFNERWAGYYRTEEEAIKCHWGGDYHPGWDRGTGWRREDAPVETGASGGT